MSDTTRNKAKPHSHTEWLRDTIQSLQKLHNDMDRMSSKAGLRSAPTIYLSDHDTYKFNGMYIMMRSGSDPHDRQDPPWEPIIRCTQSQMAEMIRQLSEQTD